MAADRINITQRDDVTWTEEYAAHEDKATITAEYTDEFEDWKLRCPAMRSELAGYPGFALIKIRGTREPGLMVRVSLTYEANAGQAQYPGRDTNSATIKRYAGEPTLEEVSILAHPNYSGISETEQIALQQIMDGQVTKDDGSDWAADVTSTEGLECLGKIRKGRTTVYEPGFQWVETFISESLSDFELAKIGKIDTPPGDAPSGGSRNYLRLPGSFRMTDDGEAWEMERRWQMSGENGWDADLYSP